MASVGRQFLLGRNARLAVDGVELQSVQDAYIRVVVDEVEAHNGGDKATSTVVVRRTHQIQFVLIDPRETLYLGRKMELSATQSPRPQLVLVKILRGHITRSFYATLHDLDEDQGMRGLCQTRWSLKQWGKLPLQSVEEGSA